MNRHKLNTNSILNLDEIKVGGSVEFFFITKEVVHIKYVDKKI